jgi:hypothetical protein
VPSSRLLTSVRPRRAHWARRSSPLIRTGVLRLICLVTWANAAAAQAGGRVVYQGGAVLTSPQIVVVFWGSDVPSKIRDEAPAIYESIVQVSDFDWLSEYNTPAQQISRGAFVGSYVIAPNDTRTSLLDVDIIAELAMQVDAGQLPPTNENTYLAVYMPRGIEIREDVFQDKSCEVWTAYHGDFGPALQGTYAVFPMCEKACGAGCPSSPIAVHELFEAVTDPHLDGWSTDDGEEIADLCFDSPYSLALPDGGSLGIQRLWSNRFNACIGSGHEVRMSLAPPLLAASPVARFELSATGPGLPLGQVSWTVSGLPSGATYSVAPDGASSSSWELTLRLVEPYEPFAFTIEARSASWSASATGTVYLDSDARKTTTGCSQASGTGGPSSAVILLTGIALIARQRRRSPGQPRSLLRRLRPQCPGAAPRLAPHCLPLHRLPRHPRAWWHPNRGAEKSCLKSRADGAHRAGLSQFE